MTNSFSEIQNSMEQFAVNDVGESSDIEALDNDEAVENVLPLPKHYPINLWPLHERSR